MLKHISQKIYFDRVVYLVIWFIIEIQNYMKTNNEKIIKYFNMDYNVHYHLAKSIIKIQLVYEETKMTNCNIR
jgi:hypothetical protein